MNKAILITIFSGMVLSATPAYAVEDNAASNLPESEMDQPAQNQSAIQPSLEWKKSFQSLDKNKDGKIDSKEAKADKNLNKQFSKVAKKGSMDETGYMNWYQAQQPRS